MGKLASPSQFRDKKEGTEWLSVGELLEEDIGFEKLLEALSLSN